MLPAAKEAAATPLLQAAGLTLAVRSLLVELLLLMLPKRAMAPSAADDAGASRLLLAWRPPGLRSWLALCANQHQRLVQCSPLLHHSVLYLHARNTHHTEAVRTSADAGTWEQCFSRA
jgi:hypothetical protein